MKTPSRWLRFLAFINWPRARRRLGGVKAAQTRLFNQLIKAGHANKIARGEVASNAAPDVLSVLGGAQK